MLPSGNDAAHALAEYFGAILKKEQEERDEKERKEEQERKKREEERAAKAAELGQDAPNEDGQLSNSASNAYLQTQDKETNAQSSSSEETKERNLASGADKRK